MSNQVGIELDALLRSEDGRTIQQMREQDEWQEGVITDVQQYDDGGWTVSWTEDDECGGTFGCGISAQRNQHDITPSVGQSIRFYGRGFGFEFHGIDIDGREVFWRTPLERILDRVEWLARYDREKRERFVAEHKKLDRDYETLSPPLKTRIDRFRDQSPSFRIDSEPYELFVCVEADKIAALLRPRVEAGEDPAAVVKDFADQPYERQREAGLSDQHSGNTFGGACAIARALLAGESV